MILGSREKAPAPRRKRRQGKTRRPSVGVPVGGISPRPASAEPSHPSASQALEALVTLFGEFVFTTDFQGTIRAVWTANETPLQHRPKALLGKKLRDIVGGKLFPPFQKIWQRVCQTGIVEHIEYPVHLPEGDRWFVSRIIPLAHRAGAPNMLCLWARDTTDRKVTQENLRKSQALLAESEKLANIGSWEMDWKTGSVVWSDNLYRIHRLALGEVAPSKEVCLAMLLPDDREHAEKLIAQSLASRQPAEHEYRCAIQDGSVRMFRTCFVPVFSDSGEPLRIVGSTQDITESKLAQEEIQKSEALLLQSEQLANLGSWEWDLETRAITWSDNMFRLRGFEPREVALTPEFCSQVLNPSGREFASNLLAQAISSRQPQEHEYRCTVKDGRIRVFQTRFAPVFSESGKPIRIVGATQDVTDRKLAQEKIQKSEALLAQAERVANMGSWEWDLENNAINWSAHRFRMADMDPSMPAPSVDSWWTLVHPGDRHKLRTLLDEAIAKGVPFECEARFLRANGRTQVLHARGLPTVDASGRTIRLAGMSQDVTDRRQEENRLRRSEALLDQSEEIAGFGCWECDLATGAIVLSKNLRKMYGLSSSDDWNAERYWENVLRSDRAALRKTVGDAIAQRQPFEYVTRYRMPDRTVRIYHMRGATVEGPGGSAACVRGVVHDITSQTRSEEDLRRLSQELLRTQDAERRQIARNLHESAGQTLAAMKMTLANLEEALRENKEKEDLHGHLQAARGLAEDAIREVRVLSYLMHPPMLDEAGLGPTIQWYAKGFSERSGIETTIESAGNIGRLPQQVETTVFRIVQEALTNVHRYSGSLTATIRLDRSDTAVRVEVQDRGCGLQPHAPGRHARLGVGIAGMRERVKQLDGVFEIESVAGRGTTVRANLPIVSLASPEFDPKSAPLPGDTAHESTKGESAPPELNL
jgi:PAS domain S-box-containing protein